MKFGICSSWLVGCTATLVCEAEVDGEVVETREVHRCAIYQTGINFELESESACAADLGVEVCDCHWEGADECGYQAD